MKRLTNFIGKTSIYLILLIIAILCLFPFFWGVLSSLKTESQLFVFPPKFIPNPVTFTHYFGTIERGFLRSLKNSGITSLSSVFITLCIGSLAAYSVSRFRWRASNLILLFFIAPQMLPSLVNLVPLYVMMSKMGLLDTHYVLVLLFSVGNIPITLWIMKGFFDTIPREIEEAAIIDGCTRLQVLYKVMLPLSVPGLAAAAIFIFLNSWNNFLTAVIMSSSKKMQTIPVFVYSYIGDYMINWPGLMAAASLASIPIIIFFISLQRKFISGLSAGALKG